MTTETAEISQMARAICWCGTVVEATVSPCPCGGRITITAHGNSGMVITGPHAQDCTHVADNIDACETCGHNTQQCGGNNIFSKRQDSASTARRSRHERPDQSTTGEERPMLPMQGLTAQGLPHNIPPEASADYSHARWEGGFERDHSEVYTYSAGDEVKLVIRVNEVPYEEMDEDLPEDHPDRWKVDKRYSTWRGECRLYGDPREERTNELFQMGQSMRTDLNDRQREANVAFVYAENAIDSPDEVILELLTKTPEAWFHGALTHRGAVWQGWTRSYQSVAGRVEAPIWI